MPCTVRASGIPCERLGAKWRATTITFLSISFYSIPLEMRYRVRNKTVVSSNYGLLSITLCYFDKYRTIDVYALVEMHPPF